MFAITTAGGLISSTAPDVCKTMVAQAPVPIPYPVTGVPSTGAPFTKKVFIASAPALTRRSKVNPTMGDQAGASGGGGVMSGSVMGGIEFLSCSMKVFLEGAPAVRLSDTVTMNNRNTTGSDGVPSQVIVMVG